MFVEAIFTNLLGRLFTNIFNATGANLAISCLWRAGNAN
jgi:hypothetical protein